MEELKLTFVNVGYGEAALLECPDPAFPGGTFVMVIDGGSTLPETFDILHAPKQKSTGTAPPAVSPWTSTSPCGAWTTST